MVNLQIKKENLKEELLSKLEENTFLESLYQRNCGILYEIDELKEKNELTEKQKERLNKLKNILERNKDIIKRLSETK